MQLSALFNLLILSSCDPVDNLSQNETNNNSRVPDILQDKSCFISISGFTDHVHMIIFMCHTLNLGLITRQPSYYTCHFPPTLN